MEHRQFYILSIVILLGLATQGFFSIAYGQSTTIYGVINTYTEVLDFSDCDHYVVCDTAGSGLHVGDRVLLIQMKGARFGSEDTRFYGKVGNYGNAGRFEFATVNAFTWVSANRYKVILEAPTRFYYDAAAGRNAGVQLIRVPRYENVLVTAGPGDISPLTAAQWNGVTGGVLVFEASGTVTLQKDISANAKGFRAGAPSAADASVLMRGYVYAAASEKSGYKGEGAGYELRTSGTAADQFVQGRGASVTGGGGGNAAQGGGGGGSNAGGGGRGGRRAGTNVLNGGLGGFPFDYSSSDIQRAVMGGGGGGGHQGFQSVAQSPAPGEGGAGGGIIIIRAVTIVGNGHVISANGQSCSLPSDYVPGYGGGGGGAGGSILLEVESYYDDLAISPDLEIKVDGGNGGYTKPWPLGIDCPGPGGGGGGGVVWVSVPQSATPSVSFMPGNPGDAVNCSASDVSTSLPLFAQEGEEGILLHGAKLPGELFVPGE